MTTLFNNSADVTNADNAGNEEIKSYAEVLVGDGKKFKDMEALAKGKYESDQFIARLEREMSELRNDLNARANLEELVNRLGSTNNNGADSQQPQAARDDGRGNENSNQTIPVDLNALIEQKFNERNNQLAKASNLKTVEDELKKAWGSNYVHKLKQVVETIGVSPDLIDDVAARSPQAAIKLLLGDTKDRTTINAAPPATSVNTFGLASGVDANEAIRNREYFTKMRRENPKEYWSSRNQNKMHELALAGKLNLD